MLVPALFHSPLFSGYIRGPHPHGTITILEETTINQKVTQTNIDLATLANAKKVRSDLVQEARDTSVRKVSGNEQLGLQGRTFQPICRPCVGRNVEEWDWRKPVWPKGRESKEDLEDRGMEWDTRATQGLEQLEAFEGFESQV